MLKCRNALWNWSKCTISVKIWERYSKDYQIFQMSNDKCMYYSRANMYYWVDTGCPWFLPIRPFCVLLALLLSDCKSWKWPLSFDLGPKEWDLQVISNVRIEQATKSSQFPFKSENHRPFHLTLRILIHFQAQLYSCIWSLAHFQPYFIRKLLALTSDLFRFLCFEILFIPVFGSRILDIFVVNHQLS